MGLKNAGVSRKLFRHIECMDEFNLNQYRILSKEPGSRQIGKLYVNNKGGKPYFVRYFNNKRKGISKDIDLVYSLARAEYRDIMAKMIKDQQTILKSLVKNWRDILNNIYYRKLDKLLRSVEAADLDSTRIKLTPSQYKWISNQSMNGYKPESLIYSTTRAIFMRSKSECMLGNMMESECVPYRYEYALTIDVTDLDITNGVQYIKGRKYKTYYPDFVILCADGSFIIWEHLGLVDEEEYLTKNSEKLLAYLYSGIVDTEHLIVTFEKDLRDPKIVQAIIDKRVAPFI